MTRTQIETALTDLNRLVLEGKLMDAFETYYHDEVTMQENNLEPTVGKAANRERELAFLASVTEFRAAEVRGMAVGDDISYVTWYYDYTHEAWGLRRYTQVSVQHWRDGRIIREQFIYAN